ncbi:TetR/AcrR family transcriptional regulator [Cupriavidus sp. CV2]|uniref:TetR/AcrR family transcriptional regulator n=1 Tax=Cupriavidus ulmosensis TaxID=3065913 RepID=UPI00296A98FC|nr:TetR/AcrR family transcriptional regulator [Cupriavidus sp. CV2]MDW3688237.1 TetR/AcrR family transcriptional regulator [Cupriavidus sp. CV2]
MLRRSASSVAAYAPDRTNRWLLAVGRSVFASLDEDGRESLRCMRIRTRLPLKPLRMSNDANVQPKRSAHHRTAIGQAQRAKTRAWIIECAIPVFAEHGPDSPVIDDFAKAAGIARGTFYTYFRTTRELLDAAVSAMSDDLIAAIAPAVQGEPDPITRLATAAWLFYHRAIVNPLLGAFLNSIAGVGSLAATHIRADLLEAIRADLIAVKDIDLAEAIAQGIMVFALRATRAREEGDTRAVEVIRAILSGLGVEPRRITKALCYARSKLDALESE